MKKYVIALDEGTTSARSVLIDHEGKIAGVAQRVFDKVNLYVKSTDIIVSFIAA